MHTVHLRFGLLGATALLASQFVLAGPAMARPGDLDPTFGTNGHVTTRFDADADADAKALIAQGDKLVAAGKSGGDFALARYHRDGTLDTSFGAGGTVITDLGGNDAAEVLVAHGDKLVAAGASGGDFALARYHRDGTLDTSFGAGGTVITDLGATDRANALIVQGANLVAAGVSSAGFGPGNIALARYQRDGTLDTSFGTGGMTLTDLGGSEGAEALIAQGGKLVVAGWSQNFVALARYQRDGTLDTSFGAGGTTTTAIGSGSQSLALVAQGSKLVAAGVSGSDFALARYQRDGALDTSFGTGGTTTTSLGESEYAAALVAQPEGKLVAAGGSGTRGIGRTVLVRYDRDGTLDTSFGAGGKVMTTFGRSNSTEALIAQGDKLVAAGWATSEQRSFHLARYRTR